MYTLVILSSMLNNFEESYELFFSDKYFWVIHFIEGLYKYGTTIF